MQGELPALLVRGVLALLRLFPLTILLPVLGPRSIPAPARLPLLAALALGVAPQIVWPAHGAAPLALDAWLLPLALRELALGTAIGLTLATPFFALEQGGRLLDAARGANAAEVIAPDTGVRASPLSELLRWTFAVVFLSAGGLRALLRTASESFVQWPLGQRGAGAWQTGALVELVARWTATSLESSLVLVSSGLLALLCTEAVLAVASRASPPLAQSQLALPVRALVPLAMLALGVGVWTGAAQELAVRAMNAVRALGA